jgi:hypothetical protein
MPRYFRHGGNGIEVRNEIPAHHGGDAAFAARIDWWSLGHREKAIGDETLCRLDAGFAGNPAGATGACC